MAVTAKLDLRDNPIFIFPKVPIMKKTIFLTVFLLGTIAAFSQLNFENLSFAAALERSSKTGKLIFLQFESDECLQCNEVADKAFKDKKLSKQLEQTFICIKITIDHPDRNKITYRYDRKDESFGSMFISSDGTLIHDYPGSTTFITTYEEHIDKALNKAGEGIRVSALEKEYKAGNKSPGFMEMLMEIKKGLNLETDSLLEDYVNLLPADSLTSVRTLQFIASMAPVVDSRPDITLRRNSLFNQSWYTMSLPARVGINSRIGYKSLQKAIREKNEQYAYRVASFTKSTYIGNASTSQKAFDYKLIEFYRETNDTLKYFRSAVEYYDKYFMSVSADSIKKNDTLSLKTFFEKQGLANTTTARNGVFRQAVRVSPQAQFYNRNLNNAASFFYEMTDNPQHLAKAANWSARANEFYESYISQNTLALLLYKAGKEEEAIEWQNKAIELKKKQGFDPKGLEKELSDMKKGKTKPGK